MKKEMLINVLQSEESRIAILEVGDRYLTAATRGCKAYGLYVETPERPAKGQLIAFRAPAAAFPYADRRLGYLRHTTLLKAVAAGPAAVIR